MARPLFLLLLACSLGACASRRAPAPDSAPTYTLELRNGAVYAAFQSANPRDERFVLTVFSIRAADGEEDYRTETSTSRAQGHGNGPLSYGTGEGFHAPGDRVTARYRTFDRSGTLRTDVTKTIQAP